MYSDEYLAGIKDWLLKRRASKKLILEAGGIKAFVHSPGDLIMIDFALKRVESKEFGQCTGCGLPIGEERIQFRPETPFCSHCVQEADILRTERQKNKHRILN